MSQYRSWVEVSRGQIAENFRSVRAVVGPCVEVVPVVKAEAYGHGAVQTARVLATEGARWLAVSNAEEGVALRQSGFSGRILVMADCLVYDRSALLEFELTPVIHSFSDLKELNLMAKAAQRSLKYHLKIDTGMGRFGIPPQAAKILAAIREAPEAEFEGLMTHFASSADYTSPQTEEQTATLEGLFRTLRHSLAAPRYVHLSSSNAVAYGRRPAWENMVRTGLAIYGYILSAGGQVRPALNLAPALCWKATILAVKDVAPGTPIGYGALFRATRSMRFAVIAAGYADGYSHRLSNKGMVIAGGKLASILGAVSMDVSTIDVSQSPCLRPGDSVTLLGREGAVSIWADELAQSDGTSPYSVLCNINSRVKRVFVD